MRVDTSDYVALTGRRPKALEMGCWVFAFVTADGEERQQFTSKFWKYADAAAEAKLFARIKVGRRGKAVLCP
jgi:hypothetical protein